MAVMIKCMNEKCNNYKQELNATAETCSLCGEKTTKIATYVKPKLATAAIISGLAGFALFMWGWFPIFWAGFALAPAGVVLAIISKSKPAIVISILSLLGFVAAVLYFWVIM